MDPRTFPGAGNTCFPEVVLELLQKGYVHQSVAFHYEDSQLQPNRHLLEVVVLEDPMFLIVLFVSPFCSNKITQFKVVDILCAQAEPDD